MLIEECAYSNRWRPVSPAAKGLFAASGFVAAFVAGCPSAALAVSSAAMGGVVLLAITLGLP